MKPRRPSQPSARAELSADFLRSFQADFKIHGKEAIERMRQEAPAKYAEIASRLIAASDPPSDEGFKNANSMRDIGLRLLVSVGVDREAVTDDMIDLAVIANDNFISRLEEIAGTKGRKDLN
jgi:hypothetical protein